MRSAAFPAARVAVAVTPAGDDDAARLLGHGGLLNGSPRTLIKDPKCAFERAFEHGRGLFPPPPSGCNDLQGACDLVGSWFG